MTLPLTKVTDEMLINAAIVAIAGGLVDIYFPELKGEAVTR